MLEITLPVFELHPPIVSWMKRVNIWVPEFETGALKLENRVYPCLTLEEEFFLEDALEAKISAYMPPSEARGLLKSVVQFYRFPVSPEIEVNYLCELELVQWQGALLLSPRAMLLSPQIQRSLKIL